VTPHALAIAFVLNQPNTIAIPKSGSTNHVRENAKAAEVKLTRENFEALDKVFKPPARRKALDML
jgi:aryl-alcohol dehydrogenase-like predicted oxidoreductase